MIYDPETHMVVPREITIEQKRACMGNIQEKREIICHECDGAGDNPECDFCGGEGAYIESVTVSCATCRDIYRAMIKAGEGEF